MLNFIKHISFILLFSLFSNQTLAAPTEKQEQEYISTLKAALNAATPGPKSISMVNQATLALPADYLFVPKKEAAAFMKASGNNTGDEFVGLILPKQDVNAWIMTIDYIDSGYIKDTEAKDWKPEELLNSLKKGTAEENKERASNGFPTLNILGWIEEPKYNPTTHQLIWSMQAETSESRQPIINYNTYALGRTGYFQLDMITDKATINEDKLKAKEILTALQYNKGRGYEDFVAGTDNVAKYGIAALVTGVVAKKLGLLALAAGFFIKIWKLLIVIPMLIFSKFKSWFGKK